MDNLEYKDLVINQDNKLCTLNKEEVSLTKKEYELLTFFLENPNKVHSREDLTSLWSDTMGDRSIDVMISRLRKKLGDYGKYIVTRSGFGYTFNKE